MFKSFAMPNAPRIGTPIHKRRSIPESRWPMVKGHQPRKKEAAIQNGEDKEHRHVGHEWGERPICVELTGGWA